MYKEINILNSPLKKLTYLENKIVNLINKNIEKCIGMNIVELASFTLSSKGTISRLIKKFGFKGYKEFSLYISKTNAINKEKYKDNKNYSINDQIKFDYEYSINNALTKENEKKILDAISLIETSDSIYIFGIGSSFNAAEELHMNLNKIGINSFTTSDFHRMLPSLSNANEKSCLLVFSSRATNKEVRFILNIAKSINIKIILITSNQKMINKDWINISIIHLNGIQEMRISAFSSKISQMIIVDSIFRNMVLPKTKFQRNIINSRKIIGEWEK